MSETWTYVCTTAELLPGEMRTAFDEVTGAGIVVVNLDGDLYALEDRCSHEDFELSAGQVDPGLIGSASGAIVSNDNVLPAALTALTKAFASRPPLAVPSATRRRMAWAVGRCRTTVMRRAVLRMSWFWQATTTG